MDVRCLYSYIQERTKGANEYATADDWLGRYFSFLLLFFPPLSSFWVYIRDEGWMTAILYFVFGVQEMAGQFIFFLCTEWAG